LIYDAFLEFTATHPRLFVANTRTSLKIAGGALVAQQSVPH